VLPHELNQNKDFLNGVDVLIFTGGPQHLTEIEKYPELRNELTLLKYAIDKRIIIIGICLGFQLINYHFGNKVIQLPEPVVGHNFMEEFIIRPMNIHNRHLSGYRL